MSLRNFEPTVRWANIDGTLTERAKGYLRALFDYIGASAGQLPSSALGGDGVSTTTFLREDNTWSIPAYPIGADATSVCGVTPTNGSATTFMRSDGAPGLAMSITPTWGGLHTFSAGVATTTITASAGISTGNTTLHTTTVNLTNGAAAAAGTITNAPTAGNPTKWIPINDNGTTRYIPAW